jgi:hypothetical protein
MSDGLEKQIGELSGRISFLFPILDRVEKKVDEQGQEAARVKQEVLMVREQLKTDVLSLSDRISKRDGKLDELAVMKQDVENLKQAAASGHGRMWDLAKIILAAGLGAGLTKLLT